MCRYSLPGCPYPHQDIVVNLIYNPDKQLEWQPCHLPCPWGKLSCGNLTIARPSFNDTQKCVWYTLALYASLSKFKTGQEEYEVQIKDMEEAVAGDPTLAKLDAKIAEKEAELEELMKAAREKRNGIPKDF